MKQKVVAVYAGTFDPLTRGHEEIVRRAADLFDEIVVAVAQITLAGPRARPPSQSSTRRGVLVWGPRAAPR